MSVNPIIMPAAPLGMSVPALSAAIGQTIEGQPMAVTPDGSPFERPDPMFSDYKPALETVMSDIHSRKLSFPRFEGIHGVLASQFGSEEIVAVENGPDILPYTAATLLELGARVVIKETDTWAAGDHGYQLWKHYRDHFRSGLVKHMSGPDKVEEPVEAHISYWISPTPGLIREHGEPGVLDYLGRDVVRGGFLVVQSDWCSFDALYYNSRRWEQVFTKMLGSGQSDLVMVTAFMGTQHSFNIYRRLAEQDL